MPRTAAAAAVAAPSDAVVICGAGLAGLCLAAALKKVGVPYVVLEQRGELSQEGAAIALWGNAMRALEQVGAAHTVRSENSPLDTVALCRDNGTLLKRFAFTESSGGVPELIGVPRQRLQQVLYKAAGADAVCLNATVSRVITDDGSGRPTVVLQDGSRVAGRVVVGADGARSAIARDLALPMPTFAGQSGYRGIAEFDGPAPVAPATVCQIYGEGLRAGLYPMSSSSVYWFVSFNSLNEASALSPAEAKADALSMVSGWRNGIVECVEATEAARISRNRFFDRLTLPLGRVGKGGVTLAGDALHPMTPNLGQGGCTALEDGIVLARALKAAWGGSADDITNALGGYERTRAKRCFPITARSRAIGAVLQSDLPPVVLARDYGIANLLDPSGFFDHTLFDCGEL